MASMSEMYPEFATEFERLEEFLGHVQASKLGRIKRVLARCCFLDRWGIFSDILNAGEKSGGGIDNSIWVPGPGDNQKNDRPHYTSEWLDIIEDAGLLTKAMPYDGEDPITVGGQLFNMAKNLQMALTLLLVETEPSLMVAAFHTVVGQLRSLFPGRLPAGTDPYGSLETANRIVVQTNALAALSIYHHLTLVPFVDNTHALRTLKSLITDIGWLNIVTDRFLYARKCGRVALRLTEYLNDYRNGEFNAVQEDADGELEVQAFNSDFDTLVMNAWAWAWMSPETFTAEFLDGYLAYTPQWMDMGFPMQAQDEGFFMALYRAGMFWEKAVRMLGVEFYGEWDPEDPEAQPGGQKRKTVVDRIQAVYGEGRRINMFMHVEQVSPVDFGPSQAGRENEEEDEEDKDDDKVSSASDQNPGPE